MAIIETNCGYDLVWGWWVSGRMDDTTKKAWIRQLVKFLPGAPIDLMPEFLNGCPIRERALLWDIWLRSCNMSGLSLQRVLQFVGQELPEISHKIVRKWLEQVEVKWYNTQQVLSMDGLLTTHDDQIKLWSKWVSHTDLRRFTLLKVAKIMAGLPPDLSPIFAREWIKQNGVEAVKKVSPRQRMKINNLGLPPEAIQILISARDAR